jgi:ubiquinone/menaquinone biosynthesis C-methylase UbiE
MPSTSNTAPSFFLDTWSVYQKVVTHDYLSHRGIGSATDAILRKFPKGAYRLLDLGCGDAQTLAPILERHPPRHYTGVDLSGVALAEAERYLKSLPFDHNLVEADMLGFLSRSRETFDVVMVNFSLHHLQSEGKLALIKGVSRRLNPEGSLILGDVFREPNQTLADYLDCYSRDIRLNWNLLDAREKEYTIEHVRDNDLPETIDAIRNMGLLAGLDPLNILFQEGANALLELKKEVLREPED